MDKIIYVLVTNGGGIDGRDHTDKGGKEMAAGYNKDDLLKLPNAPWCRIESRVVNIEAAKKAARAKLSPVDKLVLDIHSK